MNKIIVAIDRQTENIGGGALRKRTIVGVIRCTLAFIAFGTALTVAMAATSLSEGGERKKPPSAQSSVLTQAVLMRALAIERPGLLDTKLRSFPIGIVEGPHRQDREWRTLWSSFFKGALTKVELADRSSHILYFNPIVDVAVIVECKQDPSSKGIVCGKLCAAPGEFLRGQSLVRAPAWLSSSDPIHAIRAGATDSIVAFGHLYGANAFKEGSSTVNICSRQTQAVAELRLFDLLLASKEFKGQAYSAALAAYLKSKLAQSQETPKDPAFDVLSRIPGVNFSAAIPLGQDGWLVFLTPERTGWDQAFVFLRVAPRGTLTVASVGVLSYAGV